MDKGYNTLNNYLRKKFNQKIIKISLDCGFTCPNRDGRISFGGCIFCSDRGSGDFTAPYENSLFEQFLQVKRLYETKWHNCKYIVHLQAFTNTYAPIDVLRKVYNEVLGFPEVVGLAIATRPDCLGDDVLELLDEINKRTYLFIELGLQTVNDKTAMLINRGYDLTCFEEAVFELRKRNIEVVNHLIFGLPGEKYEDMLSSVKYISKQDIQGIKLQMLYVLTGTRLAEMYKSNDFYLMSKEEYIKLIVDSLELLPANMVIHRLTGDGDKKKLIAPTWSMDKRSVLNGIDKEFKNRKTYQGRLYK